MTQQVTLRYDEETDRVTQTYWGDDPPSWMDNLVNGESVITTEATQQDRADALKSALNDVTAGEDYNPDTESPVAKLCYDPDADELYGEVEIQPLPDAEAE